MSLTSGFPFEVEWAVSWSIGRASPKHSNDPEQSQSAAGHRWKYRVRGLVSANFPPLDGQVGCFQAEKKGKEGRTVLRASKIVVKNL